MERIGELRVFADVTKESLAVFSAKQMMDPRSFSTPRSFDQGGGDAYSFFRRRLFHIHS
jgi:hypothetical protein